MGKEKIFVIGVGIMANGIVQRAAQSEYEVTMMGRSESRTEKGMESIRKNLGRLLEKDKISQLDYERTMNNIKCTTDLNDARNASIVIEAVTEDFEIKSDLFRKLSTICGPDVIFASNTSSISITKLAASTDRPSKFVGMHFFNPVPAKKVMELVCGYETSDETAKIATSVGLAMGNEVIKVPDYPAFLLNRMLLPLLNEAFYCLMEGIASKEEIDAGMKLAMGHPMGPLELSDFVGLDTVHSILKIMYEGYGDKKYFPCPLLSRMVDAGHCGKKSGQGFYQYNRL